MTQASLTTNAVRGLTHIVGFFRKFSFFGLAHSPNRCGNNNHNSSIGGSSRERHDCGGHNEAFIVQQWASYNPRY